MTLTPHSDVRFLGEGESLTAEVSAITRDARGHWRWSVTEEYGTDHYATDPDGRGLFRYTPCRCGGGCERCTSPDGPGPGWKRERGGVADLDVGALSDEARRREVVRRFAVAIRRRGSVGAASDAAPRNRHAESRQR